MCSRTILWDVGCDRMVFAINSDLFLINFISKFNEWSLDQGQKTINPLIPYQFPYSTLGGWPICRALQSFALHMALKVFLGVRACFRSLGQR